MLYALACFLGALLLFSLEPMLGKALTPRFGGGAQVWMTCMLFFQATLLLGYLWAFGIVRRLSPRGQARAHGLLLAAALVQLLAQGLRSLPFIPFWRQGLQGTDSPLHLLVTLGASSGLVLVAVAATAPLIQSWFVQDRPDASPYRLYAASNLGSMAGLLCYPFLVEPLLGFPGQAWVATGLFVIYGAVAFRLGLHNLRRQPLAAGERPIVPWLAMAPWFLASIAGVMLLMAATNHLIMLAAAIPLVWVAPLALYLLTFALVFEGRPFWEDPRSGFLWMALFGLSVAAVAWFGMDRFWVCLVADLGVVFFGGLMCHGFLHRRRAEPAALPTYYLVLAAGGVVGGLLVALVAPLVFNRYFEYFLSMVLATLVGGWALSQAPGAWRRWAGISSLAALAVCGWLLRSQLAEAGSFKRDAYGVIRIVDHQGKRFLMNGTVIHGAWDPAEPGKPMSYYSPDTGVGQALATLRTRKATLRVGVVGMGIATLGLYAQPGDAWTFYEISPAVIEAAGLSGSHFPIVRAMPGPVQVLQGDGRRLLELERKTGNRRGFDLLVIDAFTNDVVPWHLLTLEALDLYLDHLAPDGILAIHISNPLPLDRVVLSLARGRGLYGGIHLKHVAPIACYALLSRQAATLKVPAILDGMVLGFGPRVFAGQHPQSEEVRHFSSDRPWTDERSALSNLLFRDSCTHRH